MIHNFNADGFDSFYWSAVFDLESGQAGRLPGYRGVVDDISHEGLRVLLRQGRVVSTGKDLEDLTRPGCATKKARRVEHLYAIADGEGGNGPSAADGTRIPAASPAPADVRPASRLCLITSPCV